MSENQYPNNYGESSNGAENLNHEYKSGAGASPEYGTTGGVFSSGGLEYNTASNQEETAGTDRQAAAQYTGWQGTAQGTDRRTTQQAAGHGAAAGGGNVYGSYPNYSNQYQYSSNSHSDNPKKKKVRKPAPWLKKVVAMIALGAFFGVSAGLSFYAVDQISGYSARRQEAAVETGALPASEEQEKSASGQQSDTAEQSKSGISTTETGNNNAAVVTDVSWVVDEVMPSVITITNQFTQTTQYFGQNFQNSAESSGSGIIVGENDTELLMVTNYHVIEGATTLKVQFIDDTVVEAQVKGQNASMDLAVLAVPLESISKDTMNHISIAKLGDSDSLKVGEPAIAIGNALGYGQSVTTGVISALNRQIAMDETSIGSDNTLIQTDAAINPGNSGGALLNVRGEVIGINSNKIGGSVVEGMGYAIPISSAKPIIEDLMSKETKLKVGGEERGFLGITGINVINDVSQMYNMPQGVYVTQVYEGTGAAAAGLVRGDIITEFDGNQITSMEDLQNCLEYYAAGESVTVKIMQGSPSGYQAKEITITLGAQVQQSANPGEQGMRP